MSITFWGAGASRRAGGFTILQMPDWIARAALALLALLGVLLGGQPGAAHEIPASARIALFATQADGVVSVLLRMPLAGLGDVDYPLRPNRSVAVSRADEALRNAVTVALIPAIDVMLDGKPLPAPRIAAVRMSLPSDRSFEAWTTARAGMDAPRLDDALDLYWSQQMLDVLLEYRTPPGSADQALAIDLRADRFGQEVATTLRFVQPDGAIRAFAFHGNPGPIQLDPSWRQAAANFLMAGIRHILTGADHLLFLACLVIPFRRLRPLIAIATAFTVAHSISLAAAALDYGPDALWFPPLVETLIAASIVYMALENILGSTVQRRWALTFAFGLVHGFGFAFGLRESLQFAGGHLAASLIAFNLGVEIGQVLVLLVLVPLLGLFLTRLPSERAGIIVLSAVIAHIAWHWMTDRWEILAKFPLPRLDTVFVLGAMRGLMAALALAGLLWLVSGAVNRWLRRIDGDRVKAPP